MKLLPLFTLEDILNRENYKGEDFSVAYLFDVEPDASSVSDNGTEDLMENAEILNAGDSVPDDRKVIDTVDLPFGIGDIFFLQEPFSLYSWNAESGHFVFKYGDGTLNAVKITDPDTIHALLGDTDFLIGSVPSDSEEYGKNPDFRKITQWRPSYALPREAVRVVKTVKSADPVRLCGMTNEMFKSLGFCSAEDFCERVRYFQPKACENDWVLIVGLTEPFSPEINMEDTGGDIPVF